jgi:hypothetical protein
VNTPYVPSPPWGEACFRTYRTIHNEEAIQRFDAESSVSASAPVFKDKVAQIHCIMLLICTFGGFYQARAGRTSLRMFLYNLRLQVCITSPWGWSTLFRCKRVSHRAPICGRLIPETSDPHQTPPASTGPLSYSEHQFSDHDFRV